MSVQEVTLSSVLEEDEGAILQAVVLYQRVLLLTDREGPLLECLARAASHLTCVGLASKEEEAERQLEKQREDSNGREGTSTGTVQYHPGSIISVSMRLGPTYGVGVINGEMARYRGERGPQNLLVDACLVCTKLSVGPKELVFTGYATHPEVALTANGMIGRGCLVSRRVGSLLFLKPNELFLSGGGTVLRDGGRPFSSALTLEDIRAQIGDTERQQGEAQRTVERCEGALQLARFWLAKLMTPAQEATPE